MRADPLNPLLIEWPAAERARLEAQSRRGVVAVRYDGRTLEIVPSCGSDKQYDYAASTVQRDRVVIRSRDELGTQLPLSAATLGVQLEQHGQLEIDISVVGSYGVHPSEVTPIDFHGDCDKVTHFVASLTAGAFELRSGEQSRASGGVSALGVGAEGERSRGRNVLSRAGNANACARSGARDEHPPDGCGALLRIELTPVSFEAEPVAALTPPPAEAVQPASPEPDTPPTPAETEATDGPLSSPSETPKASEPRASEPEPKRIPLRPRSSDPTSRGALPPPAPAESSDDTWQYLLAGGVVAVIATAVVLGIVLQKEPEREEVPEGGLGSGTLSTGGLRF